MSEISEVNQDKTDGYEDEDEDDNDGVYNRVLRVDEASRSLDLLGKDESGLRYAYLLMSLENINLTNISAITTFKHVLFVNISGNRLGSEDLECLSQLPFLLLLQADRNVIDSTNLVPMKYLQVLTLNRNQIRSCEGLHYEQLECLELNYNYIFDPSDLNQEDLPSLKILELRGNIMKRLQGIHFATLDSLYLAENKINRFDDLSVLPNLRILHLRKNKISRLRGFTTALQKLEYINLRENKIEKISRLQKLRCLPRLNTLILLQNPANGPEPLPGEDEENEEEGDNEEESKIRLQILTILPNLKRINKKPVSKEEREELIAAKEEGGEEFVSEEESAEGDTPIEVIMNYGEGEFEDHMPDQ